MKAIDFDNVDYTDGVVHIFGSSPDSVTKIVTIVAIDGGELAGDFLTRWAFTHYTAPSGADAVKYTSDKGDALQCLFEAMSARQIGELYTTVMMGVHNERKQ